MFHPERGERMAFILGSGGGFSQQIVQGRDRR